MEHDQMTKTPVGKIECHGWSRNKSYMLKTLPVTKTARHKSKAMRMKNKRESQKKN